MGIVIKEGLHRRRLVSWTLYQDLLKECAAAFVRENFTYVDNLIRLDGTSSIPKDT